MMTKAEWNKVYEELVKVPMLRPQKCKLAFYQWYYDSNGIYRRTSRTI